MTAPAPTLRRNIGRTRLRGAARSGSLVWGAVVAVLILGVAGCSEGGVVATLPDADAAAAAEAGSTGGDVGATGSDATSGETAQRRPQIEIPTTWPSDIDEVYGRYWLYWEAFAAAHGPPFADPDHEPLRLLSSPDNWSSLQAQLRGFQDDGLVLVLPANSRSDHLLRLPETVVFEKREGFEVVLQDCWIDDFVQQTLDGSVVASAAEAKLMNVTMKVVDGEWTVHGVTRSTADSDWFEECDARQPTP